MKMSRKKWPKYAMDAYRRWSAKTGYKLKGEKLEHFLECQATIKRVSRRVMREKHEARD